jgi:HK97 family phage major capsid protein
MNTTPKDALDELSNTIEEINDMADTLGVKDDGVALRALEQKRAELNRDRKMRFEGDDKRVPTLWLKRSLDRDFTVEELSLARMILQSRESSLPDVLEGCWQSLADKVKKYTMTSTGAGTGAELVDTVLWSQLFNDIIASTEVANLFTPFIPMSSGKMELSELGDATFYKPSGEGQAVTASDLPTAKRDFTARLLKAQVDVSDEEDEDAIIAMIPEVRNRLVRNAREVIDEAILNADASTGKENINYYDPSGGTIATDSRFLIGFDGLIHYCLNEVTGQASAEATLGSTSFTKAIEMLDKYGDVPGRLAFIIDRGVKNEALDVDEFLTMDKIGNLATLLTGQLGQAYGVPVIMSATIAKSNATGQVDQTPGNNTKGRLLLVNRDMWRIGMRRNVQVRTQRDEPKGLTSIVCTFRVALQCFGDRSSAGYTHTALLYNITV